MLSRVSKLVVKNLNHRNCHALCHNNKVIELGDTTKCFKGNWRRYGIVSSIHDFSAAETFKSSKLQLVSHFERTIKIDSILQNSCSDDLLQAADYVDDDNRFSRMYQKVLPQEVKLLEIDGLDTLTRYPHSNEEFINYTEAFSTLRFTKTSMSILCINFNQVFTARACHQLLEMFYYVKCSEKSNLSGKLKEKINEISEVTKSKTEGFEVKKKLDDLKKRAEKLELKRRWEELQKQIERMELKRRLEELRKYAEKLKDKAVESGIPQKVWKNVKESIEKIKSNRVGVADSKNSRDKKPDISAKNKNVKILKSHIRYGCSCRPITTKSNGFLINSKRFYGNKKESPKSPKPSTSQSSPPCQPSPPCPPKSKPCPPSPPCPPKLPPKSQPCPPKPKPACPPSPPCPPKPQPCPPKPKPACPPSPPCPPKSKPCPPSPSCPPKLPPKPQPCPPKPKPACPSSPPCPPKPQPCPPKPKPACPPSNHEPKSKPCPPSPSCPPKLPPKPQPCPPKPKPACPPSPPCPPKLPPKPQPCPPKPKPACPPSPTKCPPPSECQHSPKCSLIKPPIPPRLNPPTSPSEYNLMNSSRSSEGYVDLWETTTGSWKKRSSFERFQPYSFERGSSQRFSYLREMVSFDVPGTPLPYSDTGVVNVTERRRAQRTSTVNSGSFRGVYEWPSEPAPPAPSGRMPLSPPARTPERYVTMPFARRTYSEPRNRTYSSRFWEGSSTPNRPIPHNFRQIASEPRGQIVDRNRQYPISFRREHPLAPAATEINPREHSRLGKTRKKLSNFFKKFSRRMSTHAHCNAAYKNYGKKFGVVSKKIGVGPRLHYKKTLISNIKKTPIETTLWYVFEFTGKNPDNVTRRFDKVLCDSTKIAKSY
ncbi:hypothetical protein TKK_0003508 [Trichogramma kaykai]